MDSIEWGIGSVNQEECLVFYLFASGQSLEVYLLPELPTRANEVLDVVRLVCDWDLSMMKVRYGQSPGDKAHEILFLLPKEEEAGAVAKLRELHSRISGEDLAESHRDTVEPVSGTTVVADGDPSLMQRLEMHLKVVVQEVEE